MKTVRAWVRLGSGRRLNLLELDPASWTHRDLAIGLARTYRWGGHSCWSRPLSVAQHSLLVLALRQRASLDHALDRGEALHVAGWRQDELADTLGIDVQPLVADPLAPPRGYLPWEPWTPDDAADRFLGMLESLIDLVDLDQAALFGVGGRA